MEPNSQETILAGIATSATSVFSKLYEEAAVSSGFSRNTPGTVVIDCNHSGIRLALITVASQPDDVCLVVGPKGSGDLLEEVVMPKSSLTTNIVLGYMDKHFYKSAS